MWGWLLCGVVFVLMGGLPLIFGIKAVMNGRQTRAMRARASLVDRYSRPGTAVLEGRALWRYGLALQLVAIAAGIWTGIEIFEWGSGTTVSIQLG